GITAGIISILVHCLFDANLHQFPIVLLFSLYISFLIYLSGDIKKSIYVFIPKKSYLFLTLFLLLLTGFLIMRSGLGFFYFQKGDSNLKRGEFEKASDNYRTAVFFDPGNTRYHKALIQSIWFNGKIPEITRCKDALKKAILARKINSVDPEIRAIKGNLYFSLSRFTKNKKERRENLDNSILALKEALKIDPYNPFYRKELGLYYVYTGNYNRGEKELLKIVEMEPNFLPALIVLGNIYAKKGEFDKAVREYKEALKIKNKYQNKNLRDDWDRQFLNIDAKIIMEKISILENHKR
ncbi:MAG: tetratricopeptide repeat protein, partial [Thermodesulfobacteriota bacterium]|nr:tetratricopeptide repeat protein [Thermodesulfobacteriota bacterium]